MKLKKKPKDFKKDKKRGEKRENLFSFFLPCLNKLVQLTKSKRNMAEKFDLASIRPKCPQFKP